jgi:hypothetical protein
LPAHAADERRYVETQRKQRALKKRVLLKAISTAPIMNELSLDRWQIQADGTAEMNVQILEWNRAGMAALNLRENIESWRSRTPIAEPVEVRVESESA